ncbi:MAG: hypothetical protein IJU07_08745 [Synergistaceae bacterium]|nr:hypothetical protein [Synergistaceae bacterium]
MKRLATVLLLMLSMTGLCYGAASEDMSVYLRKDVFDAKMEAFMTEIRGEFQVVNAKIDALSRRVDDNYNTLSKRIDDNYSSLLKRIDNHYNSLDKNGMYLLLVVLGIIMSLPIVQKMLQSHESKKESKQQFVTLEDVKRLIAENNAELKRSLQV